MCDDIKICNGLKRFRPPSEHSLPREIISAFFLFFLTGFSQESPASRKPSSLLQGIGKLSFRKSNATKTHPVDSPSVRANSGPTASSDHAMEVAASLEADRKAAIEEKAARVSN